MREELIGKRKLILFQGDSITDCGRKRNEMGSGESMSFTPKDKDPQPAPDYGYPGSLGFGYVQLIGSELMCDDPNIRVIDRGVDGNRISDMYGRWIEDALTIDYDVLSILAGVNDIGFGLAMGIGADEDKFNFIYDRMLFEAKQAHPDALYVLCEPFLFYQGGEEGTKQWRSILSGRQEVVRSLAEKYGAIFVPLAQMFIDAEKRAPIGHWTVDGIHPTSAGNELLARQWLRYVRKEL